MASLIEGGNIPKELPWQYTDEAFESALEEWFDWQDRRRIDPKALISSDAYAILVERQPELFGFDQVSDGK